MTFFALNIATLAWSEGIEVSNQALKEVIEINDEGVAVTSYIAADLVLPSDIIMYSIRVTNTGELDAENIVLVSQIPANLLFIEGSAFSDHFNTVFSINFGESFLPRDELIIINEDGTERPAEARDLTNIRWTMISATASGESRRVSFRAIVK